MSSISPSKECAACVGVPASHLSLWLGTLADAATLRIPMYRIPFYSFLMHTAEEVVSIVGALFFHIGSVLFLIRLSDDPETAVSTRSKLLWKEATRRGIRMQQVMLVGMPTDLFRIRYGILTQFFRSLPLAPEPSALRMDDKVLFKEKMERADLPVPKRFGVATFSDAEHALESIGIACVKPRTGSNGRHTYPNVRTIAQLKEAYRGVKQISAFVTVEEYLEGNLCRATCVDGTMIGFLESAYPTITGDGTSTIAELIEDANAQRLPDVDDMVLDTVNEGFIERHGYTRDSVLPDGMALALTYRGGTGSGGSNREHGRNIHPSFIPFIEEAARLTELSIVGFDLIIPDPQKPASSQRWGFIEANSLPWIDLHAHPYYGDPIDLSPAVWDLWLVRHPKR